MEKTALIQFITDYIASRRQPKIDAFEKEAAKRLEQGDDASVIALERQELEARYLPRNWLTDAAKRAGQIKLVTHGAKFSHGDSKASSFCLETSANESYLNTASLANVATDAIGNAAALDVAKLLQTDVNGDSLLASLKRGDYQALSTFAEDKAQLEQWVAGFSQAWTTGQPASHKLAKQIYFPVDDGYHLLCPLFSSSLAQAMYEKLTAVRFSEESKAMRTKQVNGTHSQIFVFLILPKCILAAQNRRIFLCSTVFVVAVSGCCRQCRPPGRRWIAHHKTCAVFLPYVAISIGRPRALSPA